VLPQEACVLLLLLLVLLPLVLLHQQQCVRLLQLHLAAHVHQLLLLLLLQGACARLPQLQPQVMQQQQHLVGLLSAAGPSCALPSCRWGPRAWLRRGTWLDSSSRIATIVHCSALSSSRGGGGQ
jgi:hypothetical protein